MTFQGVVYIFEMAVLSNGTWAPKNITSLFAPTVTLNEEYGSQIAIHQDLLAIASGTKPATVYIYNCPSFSDASSNNNNNNGVSIEGKLDVDANREKEVARVDSHLQNQQLSLGMSCFSRRLSLQVRLVFCGTEIGGNLELAKRVITCLFVMLT